jgi:hypothetical protein
VPRTILVTFAGASDPQLDAHLREAQRALAASAPVGEIDEIICWDRARLAATRFYQQNREVLEQPRGCGFWLWKPYIILEAVKRAGPADAVVYWDVGRLRGNRFTRSVLPLVRWCREHGGMLPGVPIFPQQEWTKRDCFYYMGCDERRYWRACQMQATFSIWSGSAASEFVSEWLRWCCDRRCLTDEPNQCGLPNLTGFKDHRHDQSILSNLCTKCGVDALEPLPLPRGGWWTKDINLFAEALARPGEDPPSPPGVSRAPRSEQLVLAWRLYEAGQDAEAENTCRTILGAGWSDPDALYLLGSVLLRSGRKSKGIQCLEQAARLPNGDVPSIQLRLAENAASGAHAEIACRQALAADPTSYAAWMLLARVLRGQGREDEAIEALQKAAILKPDCMDLPRSSICGMAASNPCYANCQLD